MTRFTAFHLKAGSCICWIFKRSFCQSRLLSLRCKSFYLFFPASVLSLLSLHLSPLPFFPALVSILVLPFFTHPSLNFMGNSRRINMQSFLKANPILSLHLSHLPPPLPLQTTSALYLHFILSSACLRLSPRLPIVSSNCPPCLSNSSVCATPHLSLPLPVSLPFTSRSCSSFLYSLAVAWHRSVQGGNEH